MRLLQRYVYSTYRQPLRVRVVQASRGFVALFFVLSFATAVAVLVFMLTLESSHMLSLFRSMRISHEAKSSAVYCLHSLIYKKYIDQGYIPVMNYPIFITDDTYCIYESYTETHQLDSKIKYTIQNMPIQDGDVSGLNSIGTYIVQVKGVKIVLVDGVMSEVHHRLKREYYITDSL